MDEFNNVPELETAIEEKIDKAIQEQIAPTPRNRAERRAQEKRNRAGFRKDKKLYLDNISEAAKKMVFAEMVQQLRKLNKEKENTKNEDSTAQD